MKILFAQGLESSIWPIFQQAQKRRFICGKTVSFCKAMSPALVERKKLLERVIQLLTYTVFHTSGRISSLVFDLVARRDELFLIIKVLVNADALRKNAALEMGLVAKLLGASPLLVCTRKTMDKLRDEIVYFKHGIPAVSIHTFGEILLENNFPLAHAAGGGFYARINGEIIREERNKRSLGELATGIGVSRKSIQMYERGKCASIKVALRIEEYLGRKTIIPIDPFRLNTRTEELSHPVLDDLKKRIVENLLRIGYSVTLTRKCPFDALISDGQVVILTGIEKCEKGLKKRAKTIAMFSKIAERYSAFFLEQSELRCVENMPLISREELEELAKPKEILDLILERRE